MFGFKAYVHRILVIHSKETWIVHFPFTKGHFMASKGHKLTRKCLKMLVPVPTFWANLKTQSCWLGFNHASILQVAFSYSAPVSRSGPLSLSVLECDPVGPLREWEFGTACPHVAHNLRKPLFRDSKSTWLCCVPRVWWVRYQGGEVSKEPLWIANGGHNSGVM